MDVGFVGARSNVLLRLLDAGIRVFACGVATSKAVPRPNAVAVARALASPRVVCLDLRDGFATELAIQDIWPECAADDVIVDFGGGDAGDGERRAAALASVRMHFVDACARCDDAGMTLRVGGHAAAIRAVAPLLDALCGTARWTHCGPPGSGYHSAMNGRSSEEPSP